MVLMQWSDNLSVQIKEIDDQHKRLIELINTLHDAMLAKQGKQGLEKILGELADYTVYHFQAEEKYMQKFKYIGYTSHKKEHDAFVQKVVDFQKSYAANKLGLSIEVINFLKDWVSHHIQKTDKQYSTVFKEHGLS
ncbi:MAG: bacteriohemerythrin [Methanoregula sp.]|jgi:hemerythrin